jgi:putative DNA primase/helicase
MAFTANTANNVRDFAEKMREKELIKMQAVAAAAADDAPFLSQIALTEMFVAEHANEARYVPAWNKWLVWNGTHWEFDEKLRAYDWARKICKREALKVSKPGRARDIASAKTVAAVVTLARCDGKIVATVDQWDADPWLLNTPGGTYDLRTGGRRDHDPGDYITKTTTIAPEGDCPMWKEHLRYVLGGDSELIAYHQRLFGYCLTGSTREHSLAFAYGTGRNGKSATINTLHAILGDYAQTAAIETFTVSNNDQHPTSMAALRGARLVVVSETEEGKRWAESRIKQLTGGDPIRARFMRQDEFEFLPQLKFIIFGNHKPSLRSVNEAIRARFHLLPYLVTIPEERRDKDFPEKLMAEHGGILAWAIEGCRAWQKQGLNPPAAVRDATKAYLDAEDAIRAWIEDHLEQDKDAFTPTRELLQYYRMWAEDSGERLLSEKQLSNKLEDHGFPAARRRPAGASRTDNKKRGHEGLRISETARQEMRAKAVTSDPAPSSSSDGAAQGGTEMLDAAIGEAKAAMAGINREDFH